MKKKKSLPAFKDVRTFEQITEAITNIAGEKDLYHVALTGVDSRCGASEVCNSLVETLEASRRSVLYVRVFDEEAGAGSSEPGFARIFKNILSTQGKGSESGTTRIDISANDLPRSASSYTDDFEKLAKDLEDHYSVILWDLPPTDKSVSSRIIAKYTQGVVLVVEAGKTRWQAARYSAEHFQYSGVRVLGVILNKKKNYIPTWLYKLLFRGV